MTKLTDVECDILLMNISKLIADPYNELHIPILINIQSKILSNYEKKIKINTHNNHELINRFNKLKSLNKN